jgi:hypothetical protein
MTRRDYTGQILDKKYRILEQLGFEGMGAVYLGQHSGLVGEYNKMNTYYARCIRGGP